MDFKEFCQLIKSISDDLGIITPDKASIKITFESLDIDNNRRLHKTEVKQYIKSLFVDFVNLSKNEYFSNEVDEEANELTMSSRLDYFEGNAKNNENKFNIK